MHNNDRQTTEARLWSRLQQANYSSTITTSKLQYGSMIMIDKLLWYDYDKPCFYSFKGEGKEHGGGGQKRKVRD